MRTDLTSFYHMSPKDCELVKMHKTRQMFITIDPASNKDFSHIVFGYIDKEGNITLKLRKLKHKR